MSKARALLRNYHALVERAYKGDYDAIIALVDLETAIERANLTDRQAEAIRLYYIEGYFEDVHEAGDTQTQTARIIGIDRSSLSKRVSNAEARINTVLNSWEEGAK